MEFAPSAKKSLTNPYQTAIMIWQETELPQTEYAPLAQLDRALVYGTKGWGFELLMAHHVATRRILQALAIRQGLCFLRRLLLFPKNLASQSFLGSLINVSKAAFRSARLSAGTILLPLLCGGSARRTPPRLIFVWVYVIIKIRHTRYLVREIRT